MLMEIELRLCLEMGLRGLGLNCQLGCNGSREKSAVKDPAGSKARDGDCARWAALRRLGRLPRCVRARTLRRRPADVSADPGGAVQ